MALSGTPRGPSYNCCCVMSLRVEGRDTCGSRCILVAILLYRSAYSSAAAGFTPQLGLPRGCRHFFERKKKGARIIFGFSENKGRSKIYGAVKKEGQKLFLPRETWGLVLLSMKKRGGHYLYFLIKKGEATLFIINFFNYRLKF